MSARRTGMVLSAAVLAVGCAAPAVQQPRELDLRSLPDALPAAVGAQTIRAVVVDVYQPPDREFVGSGYAVDANTVLTAGHVVSPTDTKLDCGKILVRSQLADGMHGQETKGDRLAGRYTGSNLHDDIALINTAEPIANTSAPIAAQAPAPGDPVYLLSYQMHNQETVRDPYNTDGRPMGYSKPVVFGGFMIGPTNENKLEVALTGQSYGPVKERHAIQGSSGGPLINQDGEVFGELLWMDGDNAPATRIEQTGKLRLSKGSRDALVDYRIVQPVTRTKIDMLQRSLATAPACQ